MITSLSVLIPVYNRDCSQLVRALQRQAMRIEGLQFEILVADDGSSQEELKAANRAEERAKRPYMAFVSKNFMIRRKVMLQCPFDERIRRYGYEDVLLGKRLQQARAQVKYVDNPVGFSTFESNAAFLRKTEDALLNLVTLREEMSGFTHIQSVAERLMRQHFEGPLLLLFSLLRPLMRHCLLGDNPSVACFNAYRLCYYLQLLKKQVK